MVPLWGIKQELMQASLQCREYHSESWVKNIKGLKHH